MNIDRDILFIDTESTGTDPVKDRIVSFGITVLRPSGQVKYRAFEMRFNPGMPIPAEATAIHHITDEMVQGCPRFAEKADGIHALMHGRDLAGFNLRRFDLVILDEEFRRCNLKLDLTGIRVVDCFVLYQKKNPRKLADYIKEYTGFDHEDAHGAGADAFGTLNGFLGSLVAHPDLAAMTSEELATFSTQAEEGQIAADIAGKMYYDKAGDLCFGFSGKKGSKVRDDEGLARWVLGKDFPGSTKDVIELELAKIRKENRGRQQESAGQQSFDAPPFAPTR